MQKQFKTFLGDVWNVNNSEVTSMNTKRVYGYSHDMKNLLEQSVDDGRLANKLRIIDLAPLDPRGSSFLIEDRQNPGWSRPILVKNPTLDWRGDDYNRGEWMLNTKDPTIAARGLLSEEEGPTETWELLRFNTADNAYGLIQEFKSLETCNSFIQHGDLPEPLPYLDVRDTRFVEMPMGYKAEVIRTHEEKNSTYIRGFDVDLINPQGKREVSINTDLTTLIEMRDNLAIFEHMLTSHLNPKLDESSAFSKVENCVVADLEDLQKKIGELPKNTPLKFATADNQYEMLVSWEPLKFIRTASGQRLFAGEDLPSPEVFDNWHEPNLMTGMEKGYEIQVKRTDGVMVQTVNRIPLNAENLFSMITEKNDFKRLLNDAEKRQPAYIDTPHTHLLIGAALQGTRHQVEYIVKHDVSLKEMKIRVEKQLARDEEKFLKSGMSL
jgi:hypothetical protein